MTFDPCEHRIRQILLKIGQQIYPGLTDITTIFKRLQTEFDILLPQLSSSVTNHLPTPAETGPYFKCPKCGAVALSLFDLCKGCTDSDGGRLKTKLLCVKCNFSDYSEKHSVTVLQDLKANFSSAKKSQLGIKTITEEGVK